MALSLCTKAQFLFSELSILHFTRFWSVHVIYAHAIFITKFYLGLVWGESENWKETKQVGIGRAKQLYHSFGVAVIVAFSF